MKGKKKFTGTTHSKAHTKKKWKQTREKKRMFRINDFGKSIDARAFHDHPSIFIKLLDRDMMKYDIRKLGPSVKKHRRLNLRNIFLFFFAHKHTFSHLLVCPFCHRHMAYKHSKKKHTKTVICKCFSYRLT